MEMLEGNKNIGTGIYISCIPATKVAEEWLTEYF